MGSMQGPTLCCDITEIFDDFINKDYLLSETPNTLDSPENTFRYNILQQQQQPHIQEPSPPATPKTKAAYSTDTQSYPDPSPEFSESHFLATKIADLPTWVDPSDLSNFDLATPSEMRVNDSPADTDELIRHIPAASIEPIPTDAVTGGHQSLTQYSLLPPTPPSLPSGTTSPANTAPTLPPLFTVCSPLTPIPALAIPLLTAEIPTPQPRQIKTFPCISSHYHPLEITRNPGTTHHHHHQKPKHRFCCRYETCTSCTSYTTRKDRNRHEASKHGEQHLVCDVCGHRTAREDNMRVHVRAAHADGWEVIMKRIIGVRIRAVIGSR